MSTKLPPAIDNLRIGRIIALERRVRCMTIDALGTEIGCDHSTLSQYEGGVRPVPAPKMRALTEFFAKNPVEKMREFEPRLIDRDAA